VACFSEILSRIQEFPLRKVRVSPKESPSLDRVNSQRTRNREKRTTDCKKKEVQSRKAIRPPYFSGNTCGYRDFKTGGLLWRPPSNLP
jgi:hypothetical protein